MRPERQEFGFVGSWLDLQRRESRPRCRRRLHTCHQRCPTVPRTTTTPLKHLRFDPRRMTCQATCRLVSACTAVTCMIARTKPASSLATLTAAIWLLVRNTYTGILEVDTGFVEAGHWVAPGPARPPGRAPAGHTQDHDGSADLRGDQHRRGDPPSAHRGGRASRSDRHRVFSSTAPA